MRHRLWDVSVLGDEHCCLRLRLTETNDELFETFLSNQMFNTKIQKCYFKNCASFDFVFDVICEALKQSIQQSMPCHQLALLHQVASLRLTREGTVNH